MTGLTPIPWEGGTTNASSKSADEKLKKELEAFLERTDSANTLWERGLWNLMGILARRNQMKASTLKQVRLSFQEMAEEANKLAQKKIDPANE